MKKLLRGVGLGIAGLALAAAGISYSWTFTPLGRLDYQAAVIAKLASTQTGPVDMSPENRASANRYTREALEPGDVPAGVRFEDRQIPGPEGRPLPVRIYWPDAEGPLPLYLDIHGGGWWMGDGFPFHEPTSRLSARASVVAVSVDYRLAPEHPYPAALDDCLAALQWMHDNAAELGADPERIAIGGGSAGGNLTAALALRVRDEGGPRISFQYLLIPATDLSGSREWESFKEAGSGYMLTLSSIEDMIEAYVPDPALRTAGFVSPLLAPSLAGLPPALVVTAHFDPLRDQGEAYAEALRQAGVPVTLHREAGAIHGFIGSAPRAARIQEMAATALRRALHVR